MFVHCCHCTWCQRESGSAFAVNALIESSEVVVTSGNPQTIDTPSASGNGQRIVRCEKCQVAIWSFYSAAEDAVVFLRVGTLDKPHPVAPDIHIFTSTKLDWVELADGKPVMEEYYRRSEYWPEDSVARYKAARGNA